MSCQRFCDYSLLLFWVFLSPLLLAAKTNYSIKSQYIIKPAALFVLRLSPLLYLLFNSEHINKKNQKKPPVLKQFKDMNQFLNIQHSTKLFLLHTHTTVFLLLCLTSYFPHSKVSCSSYFFKEISCCTVDILVLIGQMLPVSSLSYEPSFLQSLIW